MTLNSSMVNCTNCGGVDILHHWQLGVQKRLGINQLKVCTDACAGQGSSSSSITVDKIGQQHISEITVTATVANVAASAHRQGQQAVPRVVSAGCIHTTLWGAGGSVVRCRWAASDSCSNHGAG